MSPRDGTRCKPGTHRRSKPTIAGDCMQLNEMLQVISQGVTGYLVSPSVATIDQ